MNFDQILACFCLTTPVGKYWLGQGFNFIFYPQILMNR